MAFGGSSPTNWAFKSSASSQGSEGPCTRSKAFRQPAARSRTLRNRNARAPLRHATLDALPAQSWRLRLGKLLYSPYFELGMSVVLLFNCVVIIVDADVSATGMHKPAYIDAFGDVCFGLYIFEFFARCLLEGPHVLHTSWNWLDLAVITIGVTEYVLAHFMISFDSSVPLIRLFRIMRTLRVVRALKFMASLHELRKLIHMMLFCIKTLAWSFVMCFIVMTIWAIIFVETIHPLVVEMAEQDSSAFNHAETAVVAYSSVMRANLSLFQNLVAGDSWGAVAVPVISQHPWTALVFISSLASIVYGVLNLIIAVVVDTFAEQRGQDMEFLLLERQEEENLEKEQLKSVFASIDFNSNGSLTYDELIQAARNVPIFMQRLKVLDVGFTDLQELFNLMDDDGSGEVDVDEFIEVLYRMRCADHKSTAVITKGYIVDMKRQLHLAVSKLDNITECLDLTTKTAQYSSRPSDGEEEEVHRRAELPSKKHISSALHVMREEALVPVLVPVMPPTPKGRSPRSSVTGAAVVLHDAEKDTHACSDPSAATSATCLASSGNSSALNDSCSKSTKISPCGLQNTSMSFPPTSSDSEGLLAATARG